MNDPLHVKAKDTCLCVCVCVFVLGWVSRKSIYLFSSLSFDKKKALSLFLFDGYAKIKIIENTGFTVLARR